MKLLKITDKKWTSSEVPTNVYYKTKIAGNSTYFLINDIAQEKCKVSLNVFLHI